MKDQKEKEMTGTTNYCSLFAQLAQQLLNNSWSGLKQGNF